MEMPDAIRQEDQISPSKHACPFFCWIQGFPLNVSGNSFAKNDSELTHSWELIIKAKSSVYKRILIANCEALRNIVAFHTYQFEV
jgi:hypothetical protein